MGIGNILYDKPDLQQQFSQLALYVKGTPHRAFPGAKYEVRVQIYNAIGNARAELINGSLPQGSAVYVDNTTSEVVIAWPAYTTGTVAIPNADFEAGLNGWEPGAGWTVEDKGAKPNVTSGTKAAAFRGSGGESAMMSATFFPLEFPDAISGSVMIQQGGSSARNVRGAMALAFYDEDKRQLSFELGSVIIDGSDGAWKASSHTWHQPAGAKFVRPGVWGNRKRQNRFLFADDIQWDLQSVAYGVNISTAYPITIRVHDSAGRVADWSGTITVAPYTYTFVQGDDQTVKLSYISYPAIDPARNIVISASHHSGIYTSLDGKSWSATPSQPANISQGRAVAATKTSWFATMADGGNSGHLFGSTDQGTTWTELKNSGAVIGASQLIASDTCILAMAYLYTALYSTDDGAAWAEATVPSGFNPGDSIIPFSGIYIPEWKQWIIPGQGVLYTADGETPATIDIAIASTSRIGSSAYSPALDIAVVAGPTDKLYTKTGKNGTWQTVNFTSSSSYVQGMCWNPLLGKFVGTKGRNVLTSSDGVSWSEEATNLPSITGVDSCLLMPWSNQMLVLYEDAAGNNPWVSDI